MEEVRGVATVAGMAEAAVAKVAAMAEAVVAKAAASGVA